jgi:hypothetical protein
MYGMCKKEAPFCSSTKTQKTTKKRPVSKEEKKVHFLPKSRNVKKKLKKKKKKNYKEMYMHAS